MSISGLLIPSRRGFLGQIGLVGAAALPWPAMAEASSSTHDPLSFTAYRDGSRLGMHRIDFTEKSGQLNVDIEIAFDVKLAFIPLYHYRHRNREVWEDGRLLSLDSETDDNGDGFQVKARAEGDRLLVDGSSGKLDLPGDTLTTSYWNEAAMTKGVWLGTQEGELARSAVTKKPAEMISIEGENKEAARYGLIGDITCDLWYRDGRWVKLRFVGEDGSTIDYALEAVGQSG